MTRTPPDLATTIWDALAAATSGRTAFTLAWVATADPDGGPQVRAMILREVDPGAGTLSFATDARSAKVGQLARDPRAAVAVHDPDAGVQVRLTGAADLVADPAERARAWTSLSPRSRQQYASPAALGSAPGSTPDAAPDEDGLPRFAWLRVRVDRIDHLVLGPAGQQRTVLRRQDGWAAQAVVP